MQSNDRNPLNEEERKREKASKADRFWNAFQMTENGKVKSTLLMYSFCMCIVFVAVYGGAFALLIDPLYVVTKSWPVAAGNLVTSLIPSIVGTLICCSTFWLFKERRTVPCAYLWACVLALACLVTMLILLWGETKAILLLLQFFGLFIACPVLIGGAVSLFLYRRWKKSRPPQGKNDHL